MRKLMAKIHGRDFTREHKWTKRELKAVTPDKIMKYLKMKIYGKEDADPDVDPPIYHRRNSVLYWKKAWSYFMIDQNTPWSVIAKHGNPTRSTQVNRLLRAMNKMEAARRGKPSQARRALVAAEFEAIIGTLSNHTDEEVGTWLAAYLTFMYNMIARLDDASKFRSPDLQTFHQFSDYGVTAKLCWTKNCMEERDPPTQILFGSRNWKYCVVSLLAVWLELHYELNPEQNDFFFGAKGATEPDTIKASAAYYLREIIKHDDFVLDLMDEVRGLTGTHSVRKFASNIARGNGCSKDDTDHRGRWKGADRQQDTYTDTTIPFVNAKAGASLCRGGAIAYLTRTESGITDEWLLDHVVPNLQTADVPRQACIVLGCALMWKVVEAATKPDEGHNVPSSIMGRAMVAFKDLGDRNHLPSGTNPIRRANLGVAGVDAELHVFEVLGGDDIRNGPSAPSQGNVRLEQGFQDASFRFMASEIQRLRRELQDSREESARRDLRSQAQMRNLGKSYSRLACQPGRRVAVATDEDEDEAGEGPRSQQNRALVAELTNRPKFLHELWKEWLVGATGKKAAKDFTTAERGKEKSKFSFRKVFWDKVGELVQADHSADVVCDRLYEHYGQSTSVTKILRGMHADKKLGVWPDTLVVRRH